jgi:hypothetical protein
VSGRFPSRQRRAPLANGAARLSIGGRFCSPCRRSSALASTRLDVAVLTSPVGYSAQDGQGCRGTAKCREPRATASMDALDDLKHFGTGKLSTGYGFIPYPTSSSL